MIKPFTDKRSYRFLQLKNKLRVLLVSDPESTRAGAALRVNVGASSEPIGGLVNKNFTLGAFLRTHAIFGI
jgi:insulysin